MGCLGGTLSVILSREKWFKRCFILCNQLEGQEIPKISTKPPPGLNTIRFKSRHNCITSCTKGSSRVAKWMERNKSTLCTLRPASLLWRFIAARASCPVSKASTNCLEMASPKPTLSLQPPQSQPWPPENEERIKFKSSVLFDSKRRGFRGDIYVQICFSDPVVRSCCHRSHSCQSRQDCSSWSKCTWLQPSWWHAQMPSPDSLSTERLINCLAGEEFYTL